MTSQAVAIITARGGSKRIPRKNLRLFFGKPIISYSIRAALDSGCFDEVMVSTDDREIADLAVDFGAVVPFFRSPENSDDFSTTFNVLEEVISKYREEGHIFKYGCCIYPTALFISSENIRKAFDMMLANNAPAVISVVGFSFPPQRAIRLIDNKIEYWMPENENRRSQDLEKLYHDAGQFYWFETKRLLDAGSLIIKGSIGFECLENEVQDIVTEDDWKLAEMKYGFLKENRNVDGLEKQ
jgi:N-acylneuraminate cytidylyltransferase